MEAVAGAACTQLCRQISTSRVEAGQTKWAAKKKGLAKPVVTIRCILWAVFRRLPYNSPGNETQQRGARQATKKGCGQCLQKRVRVAKSIKDLDAQAAVRGTTGTEAGRQKDLPCRFQAGSSRPSRCWSLEVFGGKIHDRLRGRVSPTAVVSTTPCCGTIGTNANEFVRNQTRNRSHALAVWDVKKKGWILRGRSSRLVSMVLQVLTWAAVAPDRPGEDQSAESVRSARHIAQIKKNWRRRRSQVSPPSAAGRRLHWAYDSRKDMTSRELI